MNSHLNYRKKDISRISKIFFQQGSSKENGSATGAVRNIRHIIMHANKFISSGFAVLGSIIVDKSRPAVWRLGYHYVIAKSRLKKYLKTIKTRIILSYL